MKTHLTPFQLFFLTFLYVFSGLALSGADSLFALLLPFAISLLWAVIGYRGSRKKRADLTDFLSVYLPERETSIPLAFFLFTSAAEAVVTLMDAGIALWTEADFISFPLILFVLLGIAILTVRKGTTVLGRFAETSLFLLIPLIVLHLFGVFRPMEAVGAVSDFRLAFSVMPAPIFFLLSMTTVSGDEGTTDGFRAAGNAPKDRAEFLVKTVILASAFAVLLRAFLLVLPFGERELLVYFLEYTAHTAKLALLFSVLAHGLSKKKEKGTAVYAILMIAAAIFTLAIVGGAVFSPFMWMLLLVSLNVTVCGMLFVFALG